MSDVGPVPRTAVMRSHLFSVGCQGGVALQITEGLSGASVVLIGGMAFTSPGMVKSSFLAILLSSMVKIRKHNCIPTRYFGLPSLHFPAICKSCLTYPIVVVSASHTCT